VEEEPDSALVGAFEAQNYKLAIEILITLYGDYIYGYCRRILGNHAEADDVSQTVFAQAFQGMKALSGVHSVRAWLRAIARNRCLDHMKALRRAPEILSDDDLAVAADRHLANSVTDNDPRIRKALDECLDCLDARSRALLVLRFHDELSYDEIGKLTSDKPGALRVRLARALPILRRCLEQKGVHQ